MGSAPRGVCCSRYAVAVRSARSLGGVRSHSIFGALTGDFTRPVRQDRSLGLRRDLLGKSTVVRVSLLGKSEQKQAPDFSPVRSCADFPSFAAVPPLGKSPIGFPRKLVKSPVIAEDGRLPAAIRSRECVRHRNFTGLGAFVARFGPSCFYTFCRSR